MNKQKYPSQTKEYRQRYTGLYGSWYAVKQRCGNPNNLAYKNYGGRGIQYDIAWESFVSFKADMEIGYKKGLTLERIDNNAGYSKENCRWATRKENNNNKRSNIVLEFKGKKMTAAYWAEYLGIPFDVLRSRYYRGFPIEKILNPKKMNRYGYLYNF